jgi:glycerol-3-phosphate cytidylyltransferase
MVTVITYGTFDLFHLGHVRLLRRLAEMGDKLVVGCSTDEFNTLKGKKSVVSFEHRLEILEACRYVDKVIPERNWDQKRLDIEREGVDIFGIGADWTNHFDELSDICKVVYLSRTDGVSTTELRREIGTLQNEAAAKEKAH